MSSTLLLLPSHSCCPFQFISASSPASISQYQLYAVEKWIVQRKHNTFLVVFTGIPDHSITLHAYVPDPALSPPDARAAWDAAIALLRADGAKPKETPHGTLMVTSLAHFRSDFTIVHIPSGNFLNVRDQLYANINLLRMGCSGRSALTLEDPSDSTKDRFSSAYHLPENPKDRPTFVATVLELVKLLQASLAIFGMYSPPLLDGLLCDESVDAIKRWIAKVGGPCVGLEVFPAPFPLFPLSYFYKFSPLNVSPILSLSLPSSVLSSPPATNLPTSPTSIYHVTPFFTRSPFPSH